MPIYVKSQWQEGEMAASHSSKQDIMCYFDCERGNLTPIEGRVKWPFLSNEPWYQRYEFSKKHHSFSKAYLSCEWRYFNFRPTCQTPIAVMPGGSTPQKPLNQTGQSSWHKSYCKSNVNKPFLCASSTGARALNVHTQLGERFYCLNGQHRCSDRAQLLP